MLGHGLGSHRQDETSRKYHAHVLVGATTLARWQAIWSKDMEIKLALIEQYQASLKMLSQSIEKCPDELWLLGEHPRQFWRIAWHAVFFAHNYMVQTFDDFNASAVDWPDGFAAALGVSKAQPTVEIEPYELPAEAEPITRNDLIKYISYLRSLVDETILDLDLRANASKSKCMLGIF